MHECASDKETEEGKSKGRSMEISKSGMKKISPNGLSLPSKNTIIIINIIDGISSNMEKNIIKLN